MVSLPNWQASASRFCLGRRQSDQAAQLVDRQLRVEPEPAGNFVRLRLAENGQMAKHIPDLLFHRQVLHRRLAGEKRLGDAYSQIVQVGYSKGPLGSITTHVQPRLELMIVKRS